MVRPIVDLVLEPVEIPLAIEIEVLRGPFLDFYDPWGNRVEVVGYENIQFSNSPCARHGPIR